MLIDAFIVHWLNITVNLDTFMKTSSYSLHFKVGNENGIHLVKF